MSLTDDELRRLGELAETLASSDPDLGRALTDRPRAWRRAGRLGDSSGGGAAPSRPAANTGRPWAQWIPTIVLAVSIPIMICGVVLAQVLLIDVGLLMMVGCPVVLAGARPRHPPVQ